MFEAKRSNKIIGNTINYQVRECVFVVVLRNLNRGYVYSRDPSEVIKVCPSELVGVLVAKEDWVLCPIVKDIHNADPVIFEPAPSAT